MQVSDVAVQHRLLGDDRRRVYVKEQTSIVWIIYLFFSFGFLELTQIHQRNRAIRRPISDHRPLFWHKVNDGTAWHRIRQPPMHDRQQIEHERIAADTEQKRYKTSMTNLIAIALLS